MSIDQLKHEAEEWLPRNELSIQLAFCCFTNVEEQRYLLILGEEKWQFLSPTKGRMKEWKNEWMNEWMNEWEKEQGLIFFSITRMGWLTRDMAVAYICVTPMLHAPCTFYQLFRGKWEEKYKFGKSMSHSWNEKVAILFSLYMKKRPKD